MPQFYQVVKETSDESLQHELVLQSASLLDASARGESRILELDGIRGIAVLLVMVYHGFGWGVEVETRMGIPRVINLLSRTGWTGVDLFFVLSGFLITGILIDSVGKPHYYRNFYGRRALRILPLYYLVLLIILLFYPHSGSFVLLGFFYCANLASIFGVMNIYRVLWSLSVEEHFYLLWPWVISRLKPRSFALVALGIIVVVPIVRAISFYHGWDTYCLSWCRFDSLASGAFFAIFVRAPGITSPRVYRFSLGCLVAAALLWTVGLPLGIYTRTRLFGATFMYTFANLLYAGLIGVTLSRALPGVTALMRLKLLRRCGDLSYCLYITHVFIFGAWDWFFGKYRPLLVTLLGKFGTTCLRAGMVYAVCFLVAAISQRYFEGPILKMKRAFT